MDNGTMEVLVIVAFPELKTLPSEKAWEAGIIDAISTAVYADKTLDTKAVRELEYELGCSRPTTLRPPSNQCRYTIRRLANDKESTGRQVSDKVCRPYLAANRFVRSVQRCRCQTIARRSTFPVASRCQHPPGVELHQFLPSLPPLLPPPTHRKVRGSLSKVT